MKLLECFRWRRARQPDLIRRDADALIALYGNGAYEEVRTRAREARSGGTIDANRPRGHWDRVRVEIGKRTGRDRRLDTGTRYTES